MTLRKCTFGLVAFEGWSSTFDSVALGGGSTFGLVAFGGGSSTFTSLRLPNRRTRRLAGGDDVSARLHRGFFLGVSMCMSMCMCMGMRKCTCINGGHRHLEERSETV